MTAGTCIVRRRVRGQRRVPGRLVRPSGRRASWLGFCGRQHLLLGGGRLALCSSGAPVRTARFVLSICKEAWLSVGPCPPPYVRSSTRGAFLGEVAQALPRPRGPSPHPAPVPPQPHPRPCPLHTACPWDPGKASTRIGTSGRPSPAPTLASTLRLAPTNRASAGLMQPCPQKCLHTPAIKPHEPRCQDTRGSGPGATAQP